MTRCEKCNNCHKEPGIGQGLIRYKEKLLCLKCYQPHAKEDTETPKESGWKIILLGIMALIIIVLVILPSWTS